MRKLWGIHGQKPQCWTALKPQVQNDIGAIISCTGTCVSVRIWHGCEVSDLTNPIKKDRDTAPYLTKFKSNFI